MKFIDFEKKYGPSLLITSSRIELQEKNMPYLRRLISEWKRKNWILELKRGLYIINRDYYKEQLSLYYLANFLYFPSYISLETALSFYNFIPEGVYSITSVSSKKTNYFKNDFGDFYYASLKKELFFGYTIVNNQKQKYFFANKEKALLDFLYLNLKKIKIETDLIELYRFQNLDTLNLVIFNRYLKIFNNQKLTKIATGLLESLKNENYQKL